MVARACGQRRVGTLPGGLAPYLGARLALPAPRGAGFAPRPLLGSRGPADVRCCRVAPRRVAPRSRRGCCGGGALGTTRPTPRWRARHLGSAAPPNRASCRAGAHPRARRGRPRGRQRRAAPADAPGGAHEVPGRRAARARGAGPGEGRPRADRVPAHRAAQAAGRRGDGPGQDRRPGHLAAPAARRGRPGLRRGARPQGDDDARRRAGAARGVRAASTPGAGAGRREAGGAAVGDLAPAREPVPGPGLRGRGRADRHAGPPTGRLGAARAAVPVLRVRRCRRTRVHAAARGRPRVSARQRPGADAAPGPGGRGHGRAAIAPSCSPTSPGSARPPRRCSPPRRPTRTRCWSWCRTWSRRTGRTRSGCGRRSVGPRWSTATASGSTPSRTS